ncbi:MAG TPA: alkaline phosphatase family protein, partial [Vicinamibacterales bacterium]
MTSIDVCQSWQTGCTPAAKPTRSPAWMVQPRSEIGTMKQLGTALAGIVVVLIGMATVWTAPRAITNGDSALDAIQDSRVIPPSAEAAAQLEGLRSKIQHIVFIVKENRSFDNVFGTFPGADGAMSGFISTGEEIPLGHATDQTTRDLGHEWEDAHLAIDNGKMDRFDLVQGGNVNGDFLSMTQFLDSDIPNYWSYAEHFALADRMFSALAGPSFPNHLYTVAAQGGGAINVPKGRI